MNTPRLAQQRGAALILFLGVSAALAVLSIAVVMAVANAAHNTSREKRHATAFNIAEAGLDVAMQQLGHRWPNRETRAYAPWTELENTTFAKDFFGSETLPTLPDGGHYISVRAFDDVESSTPLPDGWEQTASTWDANRNGMMLVDAQARVRDRSVRIRGTVRVVYYRLGVARGVAVWADGTLSGTGSGNDPGITAEVLAFNSYQAMVHAGNYANTGLWAPGVITQDLDPDTQPPISQDTVDALVQIAKNTGRYFDGANAEADMQTALAGADPGPFEGLVVLDYRDTAGGTVTLDAGKYGGDYNCTISNNGQQTVVTAYGDPGALLILGANLVLKGGLHYYGLIYVEGAVGADTSGSLAGKPVIHGMLICMKAPDATTGGDINLAGRVQVRYNANAVRDLDQQLVTGVQLVGNGWRELQPTPPTP